MGGRLTKHGWSARFVARPAGAIVMEEFTRSAREAQGRRAGLLEQKDVDLRTGDGSRTAGAGPGAGAALAPFPSRRPADRARTAGEAPDGLPPSLLCAAPRAARRTSRPVSGVASGSPG